MVSNNNNTIIENVEYLDMIDPENSWYFDAERFDPNFPLVRSYNEGSTYHFKELFSEWYDYWNAVFSYYRNIPDMSGICYVVDAPDMADSSDGYYYVNSTLYSRITNHLEYEFLFQTKQVLPNGKKITYFLVGLRYVGSLASLSERLYLKDSRYCGGFSRPTPYPHTQLIISKDWDLIKRYMFFMIRNHQYQYLNLMYFKDESVPSEDIMMFLTGEDTAEDLFGSLPADARSSADFMKPRTIVRSEPMIEFGGFAKAIPRKSFSKS